MAKKDATLASFAFSPAKAATPHDKTNAAARDIISTEANYRADKTAKLRAARLARDGHAPVDVVDDLPVTIDITLSSDD
ncbi:hypothetical protein BFP70_19220 [Thioclava sp. SK-1]|nr:hypothetical protein BFP70_19220 [Thioclava sp. SK-1]